jgi:hypothetical protein
MRAGQKIGKRPPFRDHFCRICGQEFQSTRSDAVYCTASCRKVASRMRPEIEHLTASVNRAHANMAPGLYDAVDEETKESDIEKALVALSALWPDLQPWIRAMLKRQACKELLQKRAQ